MANKIVIDVEARFKDETSDGVEDAEKKIDDLKKAAKLLQKEIDKLHKKKAKPTFDADNNKFIKKVREAEAKAKKFGKMKTAAVLSVIDKASTAIGKAMAKAKAFGGRTWSAIVKVKDIATDVLSRVSAIGKSIAGKTWTAIVKIKDLATAPIKKIYNALTSLKTLAAAAVTGLVFGKATQMAVTTPVSYADSIESSRIAFESKLGSAEKAESFLQDIYKFDEKSPFDTLEIVGIAQQMMNLGWTAENVLDDLGTIGDWSASMGKGEEGISAVTRALGQMRMKGKLSSEEMLQLTEAGVSAWQYLADFMGKDITEIRAMAEDGLIDVDTAIKGIMTGMGEYTGSAASLADRTVTGLIDQIKALFNTYVALPWGEGLSEGFKDALADVRDLIDNNKDALKKFGETAKEVGKTISRYFADKVENAMERITEITESDAFKQGSLTDKINMLWDGVIANPFSAWWDETVVPWWDSTVVPWLAEKAAGIGESIGSGLTNGITALLGMEMPGVVEDGATIGSSFMEGFLEGFDTEKIGEALKQWAEDNKWLAAAIGIFAGGKLLSGIGNMAGGIKSLFGGGAGDTGGVGGLGSSSVATMTVNAAVVNINGGSSGIGDVGDLFDGNNKAGKALDAAGDVADAAGDTAKTGFWAWIMSKFGKGRKAIDVADTAGDLAKAGKAADTAEDTFSYFSNFMRTAKAADAVGDASDIAKFGKFASGISKVSKFAPLLSALDFVLDGVFGFVDSKSEGASTSKAVGQGLLETVTGSYKEEGTGNRILNALGNTGKGAGAGFLVGGPVGALVGGVLGLGANVGAQIHDTYGPEALKNTGKGLGWGMAFGGTGAVIGGALGLASSIEGSPINKAVENVKGFFTDTIPGAVKPIGESISKFFTETIPGAVEPVGESISKFFTETLPKKWGEFWDGVGNFFTETIPSALEPVGEAIGKFFTETIPGLWSDYWESVEKFWTETVPYAIGYVAGKVYTFFTETMPEFFSDLWESLSTFFSETLPKWAGGIWDDHIYPFFTKTLPQFFSDLWKGITTFFTETVPEWAEGIWTDHIYPFFTETLPQFFGDLWDSITTFFTETVPEWAEGIWSNHIYPFFTETLPGFFSGLWDSITTFFTETIPEWAEGIWSNHIYPFFTETVPGFFSSLWNTLTTFFTETLPEWAEGIWSDHIYPFFTETVPGFFSSLWETVTGFFDNAIDVIAESIWAPIRDFFEITVPGWVGSVVNTVSGWFGSIGDSFLSGFGEGSGGGKARGGIVGGFSAMDAFARGGRSDGGIVGGSTRFIRVNEESPEMIIPLSSQRRDRALKLWSKTGEMLGVPGYYRGGQTYGGSDEGGSLRSYEYDEPIGGGSVDVDVGGVKVEIHVDARGSDNILEAIKAQGDEIADAVAGILADVLGGQFSNTPLRGGV